MGKVGGGVHSNVNKRAKRFELVRRRLGVEKRKLAGLREKHLENVALVSAGARTGKAARRALRLSRRAAKSKLVRRLTPTAPRKQPVHVPCSSVPRICPAAARACANALRA